MKTKWIMREYSRSSTTTNNGPEPVGELDDVRLYMIYNTDLLDKPPQMVYNELGGIKLNSVMVTALEGHVEAFRLLVYVGADVKLSNKSGETAIGLSKLCPNCDLFEKVMQEFTLEKGNHNGGEFHADDMNNPFSALQRSSCASNSNELKDELRPDCIFLSQNMVWNMDTYKFVNNWEGHSHIITDVRFKPNSAIFATSSFDRTVQIWDEKRVSIFIGLFF